MAAKRARPPMVFGVRHVHPDLDGRAYRAGHHARHRRFAILGSL
jgi:hypothetical protein